MPTPNQHNPTEMVALETWLFQECDAMAKYAFASGMTVPNTVIQLLADARHLYKDGAVVHAQVGSILKKLTRAHQHLSKIVAPATPRSIIYLAKEEQKTGLWAKLGPIPLIRSLTLLSFLSLFLFIGLSVLKVVDGNVNWSVDWGWSLFWNELFVLSATTIGACFFALFQANRHVVEGTFDPKYNPSYWTRIILGAIAGMILALLIPLNLSNDLQAFSKPLIGLLGGFSVSVVYRLLNRLVVTIESLFQGDMRDMIAAQTQKAKARTEEEHLQQRMKTAAGLLALKEQIGQNADPDILRQQFNHIIEDLVPVDLEDPAQSEATSQTQKNPKTES